jgi:cytochrome P450
MLEDDAALPPEKSELQLIKDLTGVAYVAGSDTTLVTITSYFLTMLVYPDVQAKAQAEIDRIVGTDRLPEPSDEPNLPYVQAVVNECYRWIPVIPMGWSFLL